MLIFSLVPEKLRNSNEEILSCGVPWMALVMFSFQVESAMDFI